MLFDAIYEIILQHSVERKRKLAKAITLDPTSASRDSLEKQRLYDELDFFSYIRDE